MAGRVLIEPVADAAALRTSVTEQEWRQAAEFASGRRRNEYLSWRAVVRRELGRDVKIFYDETGAPRVDTPDTYISVSHARDMIAVAIADCRCGIDIESIDRNFDRVADRYLSLRERLLCSDVEWPAMVWCAKEAMYKLYGRRGIALKDDLIVESYDSVRQIIGGRMAGADGCAIRIEKIEDYIVASII
ncbi:MAG: 4'-phosphopantetheinyl transferase superfamily protein [Alistipes sp.]|nr:4'-phosphopantetheinyl transferase superfamily protein [Alistipes sp.]MDE7129784.1 4'-phosphopantetheinyl transferase superfamily protein [Alistipes sp.]